VVRDIKSKNEKVMSNKSAPFPEDIPNWIAGAPAMADGGAWVEKMNPATGELLNRSARSGEADVARAIAVAREAQPGWADVPPVARGDILHAIANAMEARREDIARTVALETGKSMKEALGETGGAISQARFMAGEGQRMYGRTSTSGASNKYAMTIRQPVGVAGLIIAANTPIANVAWKLFPALICGNAVVLKAPEDTPATVWIMAEIAKSAGLPDGVLNIIQGLGVEAGEPIVRHLDVDVVSFTGSTAVGRHIAEIAGRRLAKVSLELGGKNPLLVCEDANLENAVMWTCLSAYSNAGQRCASGSRIIVVDSVYEKFLDMLVAATADQKVGPGDEHDLGPVINERQLKNMLAAVEGAKDAGARIHIGGKRLAGPEYEGGYYMAPTVIDGVGGQDEISTTELFGPIACLYRVEDYDAALAMANDSPYGLTACIHTRNSHRAMHFVQHVQSGVAVVNAGTYGSEPHMPFGGVKQSGNGSREPGTEALDIYSDLKDVYWIVDPGDV
jgi:acyl-CoA reductase-like NAD-dependent aldehyde dehydrogenase